MRCADFLGTWQITREIDDALSGAARFAGLARITQPEGGAQAAWTYAETGSLTLASGHRMQAERRYLWHPEAGGFRIAFADGRAFHHLRFGAGAQDAHWCDPDQYDVTYALQDWPHWCSTWRVRGPRKDYTMTTHYRR